MQPFDDECRARIQKHRAMRREKGFETIECYTNLAALEGKLPQGGAALLECLSNLAANERYSPEGAGEGALEALVAGVDVLRAQCETLVVVSNEVFCGGSDYAGDTQGYLRLLADANRALAARADAVCEVVCGVPHYYKGGQTL
jgi:adenosylcobinamide kinase/adenosylcobinamide-phosphate guanylyltransferase